MGEVLVPARAAGSVVPRLEIVYSPYRQLYQPILGFVKKTEKQKPGRLIAVIIPELVGPRRTSPQSGRRHKLRACRVPLSALRPGFVSLAARLHQTAQSPGVVISLEDGSTDRLTSRQRSELTFSYY